MSNVIIKISNGENSSLTFHDDGTYITPSGVSYWKIENGDFYYRHKDDRSWDKATSTREKEVVSQLLEAIDILIDKHLFEEEGLDG